MGVIFDEELKKLRTRFMEMGIDASEQIYKAAKAFTDHDSALAREVLATDAQINDEEISLEKRALKLMALQQPLASDFRKIISILKASNDVERLGITPPTSPAPPSTSTRKTTTVRSKRN